MSMVCITLPFPPSANNLFINLKRGGRAKSPRYAAWCTEAGWAAKSQRAGKVEGAYALYIVAGRPDARRRDLPNIEKPISDLLVSLGIVEDDHLIQHLDMRWSGKGKTVLVNVVATQVAA